MEAGQSSRTQFSKSSSPNVELDQSVPGPMYERDASLPTTNDDCESIEDADGYVGLVFGGKRYGELTNEDMIAREFTIVDDADLFYTRYAKAVGFSVRKGYMDRNKHNVVTRRKWTCSKEGHRRRKWIELDGRVNTPRPETRENCGACMRINLSNRTGLYTMCEFQREHSHDLATPRHSAYLVSHRRVMEPEIAQANSMRQACIRTSRCYEYLVDQAGGYVHVGFNIKDLHNKLYRNRLALILEGDSEAALSYMNAKASTDSGFYCRFMVDEEDRLANLFWQDSESLYDYTCFGDVIMFDSTYKTNVYGKPLVLFVGMNNHRMNVVFASALICNETADTYCWILKTFLESMAGKMPISVFTDGDEAMRSAIQQVFPGVRHRLCSWHLLRSVSEITNNPPLLLLFKECLYQHITEEEFEVKWRLMVDRFQLHENKTMKGLYKRKGRWAQATFRGHFLGGIYSTQRCESMNFCMKDFLKRSSMKIQEGVSQLDRGVLRVRNKCTMEDFRNLNSTPVLTTPLRMIEKHAAKVYTEKVFYIVQVEINAVAQLNVMPPTTFPEYSSYIVCMYGNLGRNWTVNYIKHQNEHIECSCDSLQSKGTPCSHIFGMMKWEGMMEIPKSLIFKRFTKEARLGIPFQSKEDNYFDDAVQAARYGAIGAMCKKLCHVASKSSQSFDEVKHEVASLTKKFESLTPNIEGLYDKVGSIGFKDKIIRDGNIAIARGIDNPPHTFGKYKCKTKRQACSICRVCGHTRTTCPLRPGAKKITGPQFTPEGEGPLLSSREESDSLRTESALYQSQGLADNTHESINEYSSLNQQGTSWDTLPFNLAE